MSRLSGSVVRLLGERGREGEALLGERDDVVYSPCVLIFEG